MKLGVTNIILLDLKRIVEKKVALSATIHSSKGPSFQDNCGKIITVKRKKNTISTIRIFDIARERNYNVNKLLCYDYGQKIIYTVAND